LAPAAAISRAHSAGEWPSLDWSSRGWPSFPLDHVSARDIAIEIDQFGHAQADPRDFHSLFFSPVYQFDRERLDVA
jgi:hypothetical protein